MTLQSMRSMKLALGAAAMLLWPTAALADGSAAETWNFHGKNIENTADSTGATSITTANIDDLEIEWIYNIDELQGANAVGSKTRALNFPAQGVAVDKNGRIIVSTFDGRILVLNGNKMQKNATNPDGTSIPRVDDIFDLVAERRYFRPKDDDGDDIVSNRLHPSIDDDTIYAGNYFYFVAVGTGGFVPELMPPFPGSGTDPQGAVLYSIDKDSGKLNWKSIVDDQPHTMLTMSPVAYGDLVYVGLASELSGSLGLGAPYNPDTPGNPSDPWFGSCCNYQGAIAALDRDTGEVVWKVYTLPEQDVPTYEEVDADGSANVWVGASIWGGGNPAIDTERNSIYVGTGEAYLSTTAADECETAKLAATFPGDPMDDGCLDFNQDGSPIVGPITNVDVGGGVSHASHPLVDAVISLDKDSGKINWARRVGGYDLWSFACFTALGDPTAYPATPLCPPYLRIVPNVFLQLPVSLGGFGQKDLDIAEQPMLVKDVVMPNGSTKDIVLVTSKASNVFAFDAEDGSDVWASHASFGPGSLFGGGIIWGSATDGERLYSVSTTSAITFANLNDRDMAVVKKSCPRDLFVDGVWPGGIYLAVDVATGAIAWQTCVTGTQIDTDTRLPLEGKKGKPVIRAGNAESPVSVANGIVYAGGARRLGALDPAGDPDFPVDFLTEVVALDAETGEVLRRFPMSLPGEPAAFNIRYQRPIAVGDTLYMTNGFKEPLGGSAFGEPDPNAVFSRVVAYSLDTDD